MARFTIFIPDDLAARLEASLGDVPRSKFIRRALEKALGDPCRVENPDGSVGWTHATKTVYVGPDDEKPPKKAKSKVEKAPVSVQRPGSSEPSIPENVQGLMSGRQVLQQGARNPRVKGPIEKGR